MVLQTFPVPSTSSGGLCVFIVSKLYLAHPFSYAVLAFLSYWLRTQGTRPLPQGQTNRRCRPRQAQLFPGLSWLSSSGPNLSSSVCCTWPSQGPIHRATHSLIYLLNISGLNESGHQGLGQDSEKMSSLLSDLEKQPQSPESGCEVSERLGCCEDKERNKWSWDTSGGGRF